MLKTEISGEQRQYRDGENKVYTFLKLLVLGVYKRFFNMLGLIETVWRYTFRIYILLI